MKRIFRVLAALLLVVVVIAAAGLAWAHLSLRRAQLPLPDLLSLAPPTTGSDLPVAISYINTASQPMPRSAVLDPGSDPAPQAAYVMSHPSFVLRWADGRLLLIDAGMTPEAAIEFGKPLEMVAGAEPVEAHASTATVLAGAAARVGGILFTHQHTDHVGGIGELCSGRAGALPVFMTTTQATHANYTTRPGRALIDAAECAQVTPVGSEAISGVPGFTGVSVFAAGGHTPGTQVILAWVATAAGPRLYVFTGDVVNNIDAVNHNISKPFLYRLLVVPEDDTRLAALRVQLRRLRDERGATLLVSHDQLAIEASGIPLYTSVAAP